MPDFINVLEVATLLGWNPETVRNKARKGRLKGKKVGWLWIFDPEEIQKEIEKKSQLSQLAGKTPGGVAI